MEGIINFSFKVLNFKKVKGRNTSKLTFQVYCLYPFQENTLKNYYYICQKDYGNTNVMAVISHILIALINIGLSLRTCISGSSHHE